MTDRYQFARADGKPDWTPGQGTFDAMYEHAYDVLRFHRGGGFQVADGPPRRLGEVHDRLEHQVDGKQPGAITKVRAQSDGFDLVFRRKVIADPPAISLIADIASQKGVDYRLGSATPDVAFDCSGLTMWSLGLNGVGGMPHKASWQAEDPRVIEISKAEIRPGDLLFHFSPIEHVSVYLDGDCGGRVWNTQPSNTLGPKPCWTGMVGTGVQIAPMYPGYYCQWSNVVKIGRLEKINGRP